MIWLTWRQFRAAAAMMAAALAALAAVLALTGPGLAHDYATGIAACTQSGCSTFVQQFFENHQGPFLAVTAVVLLLPALIGLFWGAPLLTREPDAALLAWWPAGRCAQQWGELVRPDAYGRWRLQVRWDRGSERWFAFVRLALG